MKHEHLKTWEADGFRLDTWDTHRTDYLGKSILRYELRDRSTAPPEFAAGKGEFSHWGVVFEGEDFACSPMHAIDSPEAMAGILTFLSLGHGDTDENYFEHYTPKQREWMEMRAEDLSLARMALLPED